MHTSTSPTTRPYCRLLVAILGLGVAAGAMGAAEVSDKSFNPPPGATAGCRSSGFDSGVYTMENGGIVRTYRLHVPSGNDGGVPAPVVAYFHGWGGNEDEFANNGAVTAEADRRGYILVAPRGIGSGVPDNRPDSWSFSGSFTGLDGDGNNPGVPGDTDAICDDGVTDDYSYPSCARIRVNTCAWTHCQADDVDFAVALVEEIKAKLCVDTNRVFAMGGSNGGMFTWELGQNPVSAPTFRAIAPVIGLPHRGYLRAQAKSSDMPVILITGTLDNVVPPGDWDDPAFTTTSNGSDRFYYTGATAITRVWADRHGCDTSANATAFDDGYEEADCRTYCDHDPGWPRVLDCRASMGHTYSYEWSWELVLDFFDAHAEN